METISSVQPTSISPISQRMPATTLKKDKKPKAAATRVPPRNLDFNFSTAKAKRYFYADDPFLSAFWLAMSTLFPAGEDFFIASVRHYRDQIDDPTLRAEIAGFIGQEAMHKKEHLAWNAVGRQLGYPTKLLEETLGVVLGSLQRFTPESFQLAVTVCLEHYTAITAEQLLRDPKQQALADPEVLKLWLWHALEENEHKAVAFDVYQQVNGNYWLRVGAMVPTTAIYFAVITGFQITLLASDRQLFNIRGHLRGLRYLFGRQGLFTRLKAPYLDFYRRDFHPNQHDTVALLAEWREKLFGESGLLREHVKVAANR
ncbi:MAG TPA: metal-dependent hydrolase [Dongiaceae bacterium]|nr:metal-dependent hydrolase [Dongiaceae bacterium]